MLDGGRTAWPRPDELQGSCNRHSSTGRSLGPVAQAVAPDRLLVHRLGRLQNILDVLVEPPVNDMRISKYRSVREYDLPGPAGAVCSQVLEHLEQTVESEFRVVRGEPTNVVVTEIETVKANRTRHVNDERSRVPGRQLDARPIQPDMTGDVSLNQNDYLAGTYSGDLVAELYRLAVARLDGDAHMVIVCR